MISTYTRIGLIIGSVTLKKVCLGEHPSSSAASKSDGLIPITAAISRIVVFPNHIRKFISPTSPRVPHTDDMNLNGCDRIPIDTRVLLTGPLSENSAKNSIANAEAMIRFGM